ncbi:hypothetical protein ABZT51_43305 [Streptomyces sp. NPDC005373]
MITLTGSGTASNCEPMLFHMKPSFQSALPVAQPSMTVRTFAWAMVRV